MNKPLLFQFGQDRQSFGERLLAGRLTIIAPRTEIDDIKRLEPKVPRVVVHGIDKVLA